MLISVAICAARPCRTYIEHCAEVVPNLLKFYGLHKSFHAKIYESIPFFGRLNYKYNLFFHPPTL
jgi:hypothetical protein